MRKTIWVTRLSIPILLRIFTRYHPKSLDKIAYINSTFSVDIILTSLNIFNYKRKYFLKIDGSPIMGPKLNFAEVYDRNGKLIIIDVFNNVLQLRREIAQDLFHHNDITKPYPHFSSRPFLQAFFEVQIGKEINYAIHLAHYIKWLESKSENEKNENVLIITWEDWGRHLEPYIRGKGVEVLLVESEYSARLILMSKIISMYLFATALVLKQYLIAKVYGDGRNYDNKNKLLKIVTPYSMSILSHKRNYLPWLWNTDIKTERVLILADPNQIIPQEELDFAESFGMIIYKLVPGRRWISSFRKKLRQYGDSPGWSPSAKYYSILIQLIGNNLSIMSKVIFRANKEILWQCYNFISAAYRIAYYKDFYLSNDIIADISSEDSENMFLRSLAMEEIGGIVISWERSIRFGYSHFLHNKSVHVEFVTGNYSLIQLQEKSNAKHQMCSGWINDLTINNSKKEAIEIRKSLGITDKCTTIALFDEIWGDHLLTKNVVEDFYKTFLVNTIKKPNYRLIIKSKKQTIIPEMAAEISTLIREAETLGRCVVLDSLQHVCTASMASDISVALPSMAVFESILSGSRTLTLNYGRIYTELFYQHEGKGKIIFEDMDELIMAVEEFAEGVRPDLGDCSAIMQEIDPFRDGNSGKRVGNYLNWFIEGMDGGMTRDEALNFANRKYVSIVNNNVIDRLEIV